MCFLLECASFRELVLKSTAPCSPAVAYLSRVTTETRGFFSHQAAENVGFGLGERLCGRGLDPRA